MKESAFCYYSNAGNATLPVDQKNDFGSHLCLIIRYIGYFLMAQSTVIRTPQLYTMYVAKSGVGVTEFGTILEVIGYTVTFVYFFQNRQPFVDWGEGVFLAFESAAVYLTIQYYKPAWLYFFGFLAIYCPLLILLMLPIWPLSLLKILQTSASSLVCAGKLLQVWRNWKNKHSGYLSMLMMILLTDNSLLRVLSAYFKQSDIILILNFVSITIINAIIMAQMFYYRDNTQDFLENDKIEKNKPHLTLNNDSVRENSRKTKSAQHI